MRFLRHLAAVVLVVAVVVAAAVLWAHVSGGSDGPQGPPPQAVLERIGQLKGGGIPVQSGTGIDPAQLGNLVRTCEIEAALAAVVIVISAARLRRRRTRRAAS